MEKKALTRDDFNQIHRMMEENSITPKLKEEQRRMEADAYMIGLQNRIMEIHVKAPMSAIKDGEDVRVRPIYSDEIEKLLRLLTDELERYRKKEYPLHCS